MPNISRWPSPLALHRQRLFAVREHLEGEDMLLANYSGGFADVELPRMMLRVSVPASSMFVMSFAFSEHRACTAPGQHRSTQRKTRPQGAANG
jgi:hypothetical protein